MDEEGEVVSIVLQRENGPATKALSVDVIPTNYVLRYIVQVYSVKADNSIDAPFGPRKVFGTTETTDQTVAVTVPKGVNFRIVAWADFVPKSFKNPDESYGYLFYNTTSLDQIQIAPITFAYSDYFTTNMRDAFCANELYTPTQLHSSNFKIQLRRPFAQLVIYTMDLDKLERIGEMVSWEDGGTIKTVKVTYETGAIYDCFNLLTGIPFHSVGNESKAHSHTSLLATTTKDSQRKHLFVDYLLVDPINETKLNNIKVNFYSTKVHYGDKTIDMDGNPFTEDGLVAANTLMNIPFKLNHQTNVRGNLLTMTGAISVTLEEGFLEPDKEEKQNY